MFFDDNSFHSDNLARPALREERRTAFARGTLVRWGRDTGRIVHDDGGNRLTISIPGVGLLPLFWSAHGAEIEVIEAA